MNYLDLFSGIGGFHEGLKQAGFKFDWVGYSEIDKYAKQTECEKLQGFEVGWTEGISASQRYKCLGNAVTVPIVKMVGEKLLEVIK